MKALITGCSGFAGAYLKEELAVHGYEVTGIDRHGKNGCIAADMTDQGRISEIIRETLPDFVFHLAGQANVAASWKIPRETFEANVIGIVILLEAIREVGIRPRIVVIGSADEYGALGVLGQDVTEETLLNPQTPYAVSKVSQEQICRLYIKAYGMDICMTRSFNHTGAGQREGYVFTDFSSGIMKVRKGLQSSLKVGNLSSLRDFTHVKDVVRAYRLIAEKGVSGEVYNVGSGETHSAQEILDCLLQLAGEAIRVEQDPARMRPSDTPVIRCNHQKLTRDTGWEPEICFEDLAKDVFNYYSKLYDR